MRAFGWTTDKAEVMKYDHARKLTPGDGCALRRTFSGETDVPFIREKGVDVALALDIAIGAVEHQYDVATGVLTLTHETTKIDAWRLRGALTSMGTPMTTFGMPYAIKCLSTISMII